MPVWKWYLPARGGVWFAVGDVYYDRHELFYMALVLDYKLLHSSDIGIEHDSRLQ